MHATDRRPILITLCRRRELRMVALYSRRITRLSRVHVIFHGMNLIMVHNECQQTCLTFSTQLFMYVQHGTKREQQTRSALCVAAHDAATKEAAGAAGEAATAHTYGSCRDRYRTRP